jgi:hypothetical protein
MLTQGPFDQLPVSTAAAATCRPTASRNTPEPNPETKTKDVVWFALNEDRPLFASWLSSWPPALSS